MTKLTELVAALPSGTLEEVHNASQDTAKMITGIGCIAIVVVIALFWAHKKK